MMTSGQIAALQSRLENSGTDRLIAEATLQSRVLARQPRCERAEVSLNFSLTILSKRLPHAQYQAMCEKLEG